MTVNITVALEGVVGPDAYDGDAPVSYPRNVIEQAVDDAITNTPTPAVLPSTPLDQPRTRSLVPGQSDLHVLSVWRGCRTFHSLNE